MSYRSGATLSNSSMVRTPAMPLPIITSFDFFIVATPKDETNADVAGPHARKKGGREIRALSKGAPASTGLGQPCAARRRCAQNLGGCHLVWTRRCAHLNQRKSCAI